MIILKCQTVDCTVIFTINYEYCIQSRQLFIMFYNLGEFEQDILRMRGWTDISWQSQGGQTKGEQIKKIKKRLCKEGKKFGDFCPFHWAYCEHCIISCKGVTSKFDPPPWSLVILCDRFLISSWFDTSNMNIDYLFKLENVVSITNQSCL